jgi:hypothetical protein
VRFLLPRNLFPLAQTNNKPKQPTTTPSHHYTSGVFFPLTWVVCCFLPLLAKRAAKGPKDFMAVRRAAVAASIALCAYLVLVIILVSVGSTSWRRR